MTRPATSFLRASLAPLVLLLGFASRTAAADATATSKATAEALFREGKRLMAEQKYPEACRKLEESHRLEPAGGTLLNLALCHEAEGKTATAWAEFKQARAAAAEVGRADRRRIAEQHASALEPRLSRLTVQLAAGFAADGLQVQVDGVTIGAAALGTPIPVDPGDHEVVARAPGRVAFRARVAVGDDADLQTVTVPELARTPAPAPPPRPPDARREPGSDWRLPVGVAATAVGAVVLGVGIVSGVRAISLSGDSDAGCEAGVCDEGGFRAYQDGRDAAVVANVTIPVGLLLAAAGTYLVLGSRRVGVLDPDWPLGRASIALDWRASSAAAVSVGGRY